MPQPVTFVLAMPRSGTTLFRVMLAGNPRLFSPPEMVIAPFETMAERRQALSARFWEKGGMRRALMDLLAVDVDTAKAQEAAFESWAVPDVYSWLRERLDDRILVDKCPHLTYAPDALARLERWFPDARYIWLVRHPGSVLRSLQNMPFAELMLGGLDDQGVADLWQVGNANIQQHLANIPAERQCMVRYEELVANPEPSMRRVCDLLGVDFASPMLDPYEGDRMREGPKGARPTGDPNMATRGKLDPSLATRWLESFDPNSVGPATHALAAALGYDLGALQRPPIVQVGQDMNTLFDHARAIEQKMQLPTAIDGAEGRRFLLRMLSASIDTFVEHTDPDRPRFHHAEGPTRKMFADNPDTDYLRAPIRMGPGRVYRLTGQIAPGSTYVGVLLYGRGGRIGRRLTDHQLQPDADGRFTLWVSTERQSGVWLEADGDENALMVRQYFADRASETPVRLQLAFLGDAAPVQHLAAPNLSKSLQRATRMLDAVYQRTEQMRKMGPKLALNRMVELPGEQLFPTPDNSYRGGWFRISVDSALIIRGRLPKARYFSLVLYNAWLESLDYQRHTITLNHGQLQLDDDGGFTVVLSHTDPGHPNWLDPAGHDAGFIIARALLPESDIPELDVEMVLLSELATRLG